MAAAAPLASNVLLLRALKEYQIQLAEQQSFQELPLACLDDLLALPHQLTARPSMTEAEEFVRLNHSQFCEMFFGNLGDAPSTTTRPDLHVNMCLYSCASCGLRGLVSPSLRTHACFCEAAPPAKLGAWKAQHLCCDSAHTNMADRQAQRIDLSPEDIIGLNSDDARGRIIVELHDTQLALTWQETVIICSHLSQWDEALLRDVEGQLQKFDAAIHQAQTVFGIQSWPVFACGSCPEGDAPDLRSRRSILQHLRGTVAAAQCRTHSFPLELKPLEIAVVLDATALMAYLARADDDRAIYDVIDLPVDWVEPTEKDAKRAIWTCRLCESRVYTMAGLKGHLQDQHAPFYGIAATHPGRVMSRLLEADQDAMKVAAERKEKAKLNKKHKRAAKASVQAKEAKVERKERKDVRKEQARVSAERA